MRRHRQRSFTAAQAAQKRTRYWNYVIASFTAAQAAQKGTLSGQNVTGIFTAAQAAQKEGWPR
uniref:hypothetical protein n=1 Tax=Acetobacter orientalis TaxID=146474 RepID=UPI0038CF6A0D